MIVLLAGCGQKQNTVPPTGRTTFERLDAWRELSFSYPQEYGIESDMGTIFIKKDKQTPEALYRFDAGACDEGQKTWQKVMIHGKTFFKVTNDAFSGEKYVYFHNLPDTSSCILFDASRFSETGYLQIFEIIMHSIQFKK